MFYGHILELVPECTTLRMSGIFFDLTEGESDKGHGAEAALLLYRKLMSEVLMGCIL